MCLREYPTIENAKVTFEGWNGKYPAPARGIVNFRCEHPKGFSDGALLHTAECAPLNPDSWCISFREDAVLFVLTLPLRGKLEHSEKVHIYPECLLTKRGKEYVGKVSVTKSGRKCLKWRDYPGGTSDDYPGGPHLNFTTSDPSGTPIINLGDESYFLNRDTWSHHNYCRNPYFGKRPWCNVSGPNITWEYCNIPMCTDAVPPECKLTQQGGEYMGRKNVTIRGDPCLPWREIKYAQYSQSAYPDPYDVDVHHNFCRNPQTMKGNTQYYMSVNIAPWCYYDDGGSINPPECKMTWHGAEYVGKLNVTIWGVPCLPWLTLIDEDWELILHDELDGGHAFCRNDDFYGGGPGCYIYPEGTVRSWRHCDVPFCPTVKGKIATFELEEIVSVTPLECITDAKGESYIGTKNVTRKGYKCLPWIAGRMNKEVDAYSDYEENAAETLKRIFMRLSDDLYPTHNFCRNWNNDDEGPWCYKSDEIARRANV
ncbi:unnamed protein product, partial [Darwinula stevensoni]